MDHLDWRDYDVREEADVGSSNAGWNSGIERSTRPGGSHRSVCRRAGCLCSSEPRPRIRLGRRLLERRRLGSRLLELRRRPIWRPGDPWRRRDWPRAGVLSALRMESLPQVAPPSAACTLRPLPTGEAVFSCFFPAAKASHIQWQSRWRRKFRSLLKNKKLCGILRF